MLSLSLSQSHLRQRRTYLTFEQFLTRTRTWNRTMYAARSWTRYLKGNLLGCGGKVSFMRWNQTAALVAQEPFLSGSNSNYVEEMYLSWKEDPKSVHRVGSLPCVIKEYWELGKMYMMIGAKFHAWNIRQGTYSLEKSINSATVCEQLER